MQSTDFDPFADKLYDLADALGAKLTPGAVNLYWEALAAYPLDAILRAIRAHLQDPDKGRFMPRPADLIGRLGHPRAARAGQCSYVRPADGEPCRFAGTLSASISGGGPYYCRLHFPPTSNPRCWEDAVTASRRPSPPPQNWRDALCDQLLHARGLGPGGADPEGTAAARRREDFRTLLPTLRARPTPRPGPVAEHAPCRREETERLLAEARTRYQAVPRESVWTPPRAEPDRVLAEAGPRSPLESEPAPAREEEPA